MRIAFSERYVVALNFLLIAGCAYFGARAVNEMVARHLIVIPPAPIVAPARPPVAPPLRAAYNIIVQRDIFNAEKPKVTSTPPPPPPAVQLKLVGVSHPSWDKPFAILEDQNTHDQAVYQLGAEIQGAGELAGVLKDKVVITRDGNPITLKMETGEPDQAAAPTMVEVPPVPSGGDVRRLWSQPVP